MVIVNETVATLRSACWPLARLRPLPEPPDPAGRPPVVLVHGFLGHPDMFRPLVRRLFRARFHAVHRARYPSLRFALDEIARHIHDVVDPAASDGPVDLVGHSLGAVACRAYLKCFGGADKIRRFVSLGGPHAGTDLFRLAPPVLWDVLNPQGAWVRRLNEEPEPVPTTVIRARYDHHVVPPVRAALEGAEEVVLSVQGHNGLLWSRSAHAAIIEALT